MAVLFWIFFDQICPKWIKLDQTCSNWISHQSKNVSIQSCHIYKLDKNCHFILDQIGSNWLTVVHSGSQWFTVVHSGSFF